MYMAIVLTINLKLAMKTRCVCACRVSAERCGGVRVWVINPSLSPRHTPSSRVVCSSSDRYWTWITWVMEVASVATLFLFYYLYGLVWMVSVVMHGK